MLVAPINHYIVYVIKDLFCMFFNNETSTSTILNKFKNITQKAVIVLNFYNFYSTLATSSFEVEILYYLKMYVYMFILSDKQ